VEHHLDRTFLVHAKKAAQYLDHEIHRGEIIIEQNDLEKRRPRRLRARCFNGEAVAAVAFLIVFVFLGH
jgi:hypothetical protein